MRIWTFLESIRLWDWRHTALKAASTKMTKHEKTCYDNQHTFKPFTSYTFGFIILKVDNLLQRIERVMHNNIVSPKFINVIFKKLILPSKKLTVQLIIHC